MFLWWHHVSLFFHVHNGFVLMPVHLKEQSPLPGFLDWLQLGKTLKVASRVPAGWSWVSLVPGRAQWCSFHAPP